MNKRHITAPIEPVNWLTLRGMPVFLRRWLVRGALGFFGLQVLVVGILIIIDVWRKRYRAQGHFPRAKPASAVPVGSSELQIYTYGEDLYKSMLQAIAGARERIFFETFIWKDDPVGQKFKQALQCAADRGVAVYVMYDSFANLVVPHKFKLFNSNIHVLSYPLFAWVRHPFYLSGYARDHRKIMAVDGQMAFVGGYNIGAPYANTWRDTHLRIKGPDARELESVCIDFWNSYHKHGRGKLAIQNIKKRDWDPLILIHRNDPHLLIFPIRNSYLEAISRAARHIYLTHAYFIPDLIVLQALLEAAERGADVRILMPETSNHVLADWLARGFIPNA